MVLILGRPAVKDHATRAREPGEVVDPGNAGVIAPVTDCYVLLKTVMAETRTLSDPIYDGQTLDLFFETDFGDCVITASSAINQAGNTSLTFADGGDHLRLAGGRNGAGGREWRAIANDGVSLA
jgi:hypothetical protein